MGYQWDKDNPPPIMGHSINKLQLIKEYYSAYLDILGKGGYRRNTFPLCFVDGFCGGGQYESTSGAEVLGSPLLTLDAALEFEFSVNVTQERVRNNFKFLFIDSDKKATACLRYYLEQKYSHLPRHWKVDIWDGAFEQLVDSVIRSIKEHSRSHRALFFLDQYGYSQVSINSIKKIMAELSHAEIILVISTDWLTDKLNHEGVRDQLLKLHFPLNSVEQLISELKAGPTNEKMTEPQFARERCQSFVINTIVRNIGLKPLYFNPYCITSKGSNKSYVMLHLSSNLRAKDAMLCTQWKVGNIEGSVIHEGKGGLSALVFSSHEGQSFLFQDHERKINRTDLEAEIPKFLHLTGKQTALDIFSKIANLTPAPKQDVYDVINKLSIYKIVSAKTPAGHGIRGKVSDDTIIELPPQPSLFLPI